MKKVLISALIFAMMFAFGTSCQRENLDGVIRVVVYDRGTDGGRTNPTRNNWTDWIQENFYAESGYNVQFVPVPRAQEEQAQVNLMAAGNPPDIMKTFSLENITNWGEMGGLFDMAPYIDTHLYNLRELLGYDPVLPGRYFIHRNKNAQTGQVFSIPGRRVNVARFNTFIREDWLEALNLPIPSNAEEFFNTMVAFRDRIPAVLGVDNVIPFIMTQDVRWTAGAIAESFIDPDISTRDLWINSIVDRFFLVPGYKEGIRFLNRMYNNGLIGRDFPLYADDEIYNNLIKSGVVGAFAHNWDQIFRESDRILSDLQEIVPTARLIPIDTFSSSGVNISYDAEALYFFIPAGSRNPHAAMSYLNWLSRFEIYNFLQIGPEGIVHEMVDGVPRINPVASDGWIQNSSMNIDYTPMLNGLFLGTEEASIRAMASAYPWPAEMIMEAYRTAMINARPIPVVATTAPLRAAGPLSRTLIDMSIAFVIRAIRAPEGDFDTEWNTGITNWLTSGAEAIRREREELYIDP
ncbi:MAG: extracellular solute-binding protein [Treponema sp.]|nr:extracellular solute-binding protein [Treponema sp.]